MARLQRTEAAAALCLLVLLGSAPVAAQEDAATTSPADNSSTAETPMPTPAPSTPAPTAAPRMASGIFELRVSDAGSFLVSNVTELATRKALAAVAGVTHQQVACVLKALNTFGNEQLFQFTGTSTLTYTSTTSPHTSTTTTDNNVRRLNLAGNSNVKAEYNITLNTSDDLFDIHEKLERTAVDTFAALLGQTLEAEGREDLRQDLRVSRWQVDRLDGDQVPALLPVSGGDGLGRSLVGLAAVLAGVIHAC